MSARTIRPMERPDLLFAVDCTRAIGRTTETTKELEAFLEYDAKGCFVAVEGRKQLGFSIATCYDTCGIMGAIAMRGIENASGVEHDLLEHAAKYLSACRRRPILAETIHASVSVFESAGFIKLCRVLRFVGTVYGRSHQHVRSLRSHDLSAINDLDRRSFRANRWYFLEQRFSLTPQFSKVIELNGRIRGFIMARKGRGVVVVGPWVISSAIDCPADLLEGLATETGGAKMLIEVLETNRGAIELLRALEFIELPESTWRMQRGSGSNVGMADSLFAIGSAFMG